MNKIMKEWRSFMKETDRSKITLSEASKVTLSQLITEFNAKNISKGDYVKVLCESIEEDLRWLNSQSVETLNEGLGDIGKKIVGAASQIKSAVVQKVKGMIAKAIELAKTAGKKAVEYCKNIYTFVEKFKKTNPKVYELITDLLKLVSIAAVVYLVYKYGISSAHAEVIVRHDDVPVRLSGDAKQVLDVLSDPAFQKMSNMNPEQANTLIDTIKSSDQVIDIRHMKNFNSIVSNAITISKQKAAVPGNVFGDMFNSAIKAVQDGISQLSGVANQSAGAVQGAIESAAEFSKHMSADDVKKAVKLADAAHKADPDALARIMVHKLHLANISNEAGYQHLTAAIKQILPTIQ